MNDTYISWDYDCWLQLDRCLFRTCLWLNVLLHTSHPYGRSPICTRWCSFRFLVLLNVLLHTSHRYWCFSVCTCWCTLRLQYQPAVQQYSRCLHSEILARLEFCDGRNDHNMHTTDCPHKVHTQYFQMKYSCTTEHTWLLPKCKTVSVHSGKCFQNTTEMETPWSVNGNKYSDNAP